jgi:Glyoxalase-like domain
MPAPTIDELVIADAPATWTSAGFDVSGDAVEVGSVRLRLASKEGKGIVGCSLRELALERPDGLPATRSDAPPRSPRSRPHPNGVVSLDHLVAFSPDLERTIAALEQAGIELRRLREEPTPAGAPRQAFFRLGETILEVIQAPPGSREERDPGVPARFWGLAFSVSDLESTAAHLGDRLGEPRDAVQPGRRIATLRREVGLGPAVAFMTRAPRP